MSFDVLEFRKNFPQLERKVGPRSLVYFDSGASSLKHTVVTDTINRYNRFETSNVHRGAHQVSRQGTEKYESAREKIAQFLGAKESSEIIFTRGTTEAINLVASCMESQIDAGDEVLVTALEHHSNLIPWQVLCEKRGAILKVVPFDSQKGVSEKAFEKSITEKTKLAAMIHYSNSFGNRLPVENLVDICKSKNIMSVVDGAQALLTETVDVTKLGCDFYAFSAHKIFGPYGIGALYGRKDILEAMPPYQTGGSMVDRVSFNKTTYAEVPQKFEAGTPNIAGAIGLGALMDVLKQHDIADFHAHVLGLRNQMKLGLSQLPKVQQYEFESTDYTGIVSFNIQGAHPSDVGTLLDKYGFAVRAGHHCTQPLMDLLGIPGTVRASLAPYNTIEEVNDFIDTVKKVEEFF